MRAAPTPPVLHMLCGKIASGKSTLAARLAAARATVLVSEDVWLAALYPGTLSTLQDYVRCAGRLRAAMGPHVIDVLDAGLSVVLDFPADTPEQHGWMAGLVSRSGAAHRLHVLEVPDAVCLDRLHARNARADHPFAVTDAQFHAVTRHFAPPTPEEGFSVVRHPEPSGTTGRTDGRTRPA